MKESTLNPINVHFVLHCQSDSWESFSFGTSRAHGALDKGSNIETSTVQKSKANAQTSKNVERSQKGTLMNVQWQSEQNLSVLIVCLCT